MNYQKTINNTINIRLQYESFKNFLEKELCDEILNNTQYSHFNFKTNNYKVKYKRPKNSANKCMLNNKTYSIGIYLPFTLKYKTKILLKYKYVLISEIPMITNEGSFIINGNKRIIFNELVRNPGLYLIEGKKEKSLMTTIIPKLGTWLTIKINKENDLYARFDTIKKKIPILLLLKSLGLTNKKIFKSLQIKKILIKIIQKEKNLKYKISIQKLTKLMFKNEYNLVILPKKNNYELGKIGRKNINLKIYKKEFFPNKNYLIPEDILGTINFLINKKNNLGNIDDIDDLKNKRIKMIGEIINEQILLNIKELKKYITKNLKKINVNLIKNSTLNLKEIQILNTQILSIPIKKIFSSNALSQILEETNPITEITHKRKISFMTNQVSKKKSPNVEIREIHPSHLGKICPIETAEGKNAGLIWSLAKEARINKDGFIETPYFLRFNKFKNIKIKKKTNKNIIYFTKRKKEELTNLKNITKLSNIEMISIGTSLIPFLQHNDANRVLMGSNMQRQAVSLIENDVPLVGTGIEKIIAKTSESSIVTNQAGIVIYSSFKKIIIHENLNWKKKHTKNYRNFTQTFLKKIIKKIKFNKYSKFIKKTYFLQKKKYSNQNIYLNQKPIVKKKEFIKKNQIISEGCSIKNGELSIGKNILTSYMVWKGYNFEDAIIINEKLINENIFTSVHIKKFKTFLIKDETGEEKITNKLLKTNKKFTKNLKKNGIIKKGSFVKENSILVGKIKKENTKNLTSKLLNIIFIKERKKENSLKVPKKNKGIILETKIIKQKSISIIIYVAEKRKIQIGDKISGRHGNKGIVSKIVKKENMPFLQDGSIVDIILNPLGIPSRMNVGQVLECLLGLAGKNLKENYRILPFNEKSTINLSKKLIYNKLNEAKQKTNKKWIFNPSHPGKMKIFDGKNGKEYIQPVTVGYSYILKLMHLAKDKITARSLGSYSIITKQPLKGKSKHGGQRFGEMEVWAIEGFGCAYLLQEVITIKSDDIMNKYETLYSIIENKLLPNPSIPESFKVFVLELKSLCIDLKVYKKGNNENIL
uniref:DNA-directed RNA polymerase subunit beta n=1 Tax=Phacus pleuronectes TaxID=102908 RepID=A0A3G3LLS1_9EUGL|nr:RNA polymerase beta subunit [Phacus pleuronectes]AYQ93656.1 RNA polymerase beta subunit [Phacus pleuronectes]